MRNYLDSKMPVNLVQYDGTVGVFNNRKFTKKLQYKEIYKLKFIHTCLVADNLSFHNHSMFSFFMLLIRNTDETFSICHWNLNILFAYSYNKLFLLTAYIAVDKFDVICLSEAYLDSIVGSDGENLEITGYKLLRFDHPANAKRGGVCLYYNTCLP